MIYIYVYYIIYMLYMADKPLTNPVFSEPLSDPRLQAARLPHLRGRLVLPQQPRLVEHRWLRGGGRHFRGPCGGVSLGRHFAGAWGI
jgi:hypothetical protein